MTVDARHGEGRELHGYQSREVSSLQTHLVRATADLDLGIAPREDEVQVKGSRALPIVRPPCNVIRCGAAEHLVNALKYADELRLDAGRRVRESRLLNVHHTSDGVAERRQVFEFAHDTCSSASWSLRCH